ncbi:2,3-bisphosphoglycerate-independent phosphoglycerate mutase [Oligoflexaceae bacterium]|nr:2,3-bisphosphoglycerate-independent phosphoglycerate mutase [Oligoflexaceae bacterium]
MKRKLLCVVMDGVGESDSDFGNAFQQSFTPNLDSLKRSTLYRTIYAHGTHVGLPSDNDIGNSEVGHNAIGAGKIYEQGAKLVQNSIAAGTLFEGKVWQDMLKKIIDSKSTLHFLGLLSDGNVHSHLDHLFAMVERAVREGVRKIRIHTLLDGRDVAERSAEKYVEQLNKFISALPDSANVKIASGGGRMTTTMDRYEADWTVVERGWKAHVFGEADCEFSSIDEALVHFRKDEDLTDQYLPPFVIKDSNGPVGTINDGDGVIFTNFRGDRAIEISRAFTESDDEFNGFKRGKVPKVYFAGMMQYDGDLKIPANFLVTPPSILGTLGEHFASSGVSQFACSETQKYGHVTFFWNGNRSGKFDDKLEKYVEVPSDVIEFNQRPWMKSEEICQETISAMKSPDFQFGRINFANGDMVGHTGDFAATVVAVGAVDLMIGKLVIAASQTDTILLITADHGNCDEMFDEKESDFPNWRQFDLKNKPKPKTSHTKNKVPCLVFDPRNAANQWKWNDMENSGLGNLASTICLLMGESAPKDSMPSLLAASK